MNRHIVLAGNLLLDHVKMIDAYPQKGMLVNISSVSQAVGGSVPNSGIDIKKLDESLRVTAVGRIGRDADGAFLTERLREAGVETRLTLDESLPTSFTDVMTLPSGERTFFHARGANAAFCAEDVDAGSLKCDLFHLGYLLLLDLMDAPDAEYGTAAARLLHDVQARGIRTSIDVVSAEGGAFRRVVAPTLRYCDYVVMNEVEASLVTGIEVRSADGTLKTENLEPICSALLQAGVRERAVIHCPELGCGMDASGAFSIVPSLQLPKNYIVGAVGAGDAFCAGMLYSFLADMPAEEGLRLGAAAAACNLSVRDSVSGARSLAETMELERRFERRVL